MTVARQNAVFEKITDSDLIGKLITANALPRTSRPPPRCTKASCSYTSDWDLMLMRAEMNGLSQLVADGKVTVKTPDTSQSPVRRSSRRSRSGFAAEMDAATHLPRRRSTASPGMRDAEGDPNRSRTVRVTEPGNITSAELAKDSASPACAAESGRIGRNSLRTGRGRAAHRSCRDSRHVRFQARAAQPARTIQLAGLGNRFQRHGFLSSGFTTDHRRTLADHRRFRPFSAWPKRSRGARRSGAPRGASTAPIKARSASFSQRPS